MLAAVGVIHDAICPMVCPTFDPRTRKILLASDLGLVLLTGFTPQKRNQAFVALVLFTLQPT